MQSWSRDLLVTDSDPTGALHDEAKGHSCFTQNLRACIFLVTLSSSLCNITPALFCFSGCEMWESAWCVIAKLGDLRDQCVLCEEAKHFAHARCPLFVLFIMPCCNCCLSIKIGCRGTVIALCNFLNQSESRHNRCHTEQTLTNSRRTNKKQPSLTPSF